MIFWDGLKCVAAELQNGTDFASVRKILKRRKKAFQWFLCLLPFKYFTFCNSGWVPWVPRMPPPPHVIKIIFAPIIVRVLAFTVFPQFGNMAKDWNWWPWFRQMTWDMMYELRHMTCQLKALITGCSENKWYARKIQYLSECLKLAIFKIKSSHNCLYKYGSNWLFDFHFKTNRLKLQTPVKIWNKTTASVEKVASKVCQLSSRARAGGPEFCVDSW